MRTFTYQEITAKAESEIRRFMDAAARQPDSDRVPTYRSWAYGVYLGWYELTMGWQEAGDCDRMRALTELGQ